MPALPGAYEEPTGLLRKMRQARRLDLVRPDGYVAWARHDRDGMEEAVGHALGMSPHITDALRRDRTHGDEHRVPSARRRRRPTAGTRSGP